jgi:hypothetical protein
MVYSLEYTEIRKAFFTPQHGRWRRQTTSLITTAQRNWTWITHSSSNGITNATTVSNVIVVMWSEVSVVNQQWSPFPLLQQRIPAMTSVSTVATVFYNNGLGSMPQQCVPTMNPDHAGCLVPKQTLHTDRQTDMDGLIRRSTLTLNRAELNRSLKLRGSNYFR